MRESETLARIDALGRKYAHTAVVEYEGKLHIRQGRRIVCAYDLTDDTLQINEIRSAADANRVNEVLAILGATARIEQLKVGAAPVDNVNGIPLNPTFVLSADPTAAFSVIDPIDTRVPYALEDLGAEQVVSRDPREDV